MKRANGEGTISRYKDGWRGRYTDPNTHEQRAVYGKSQKECAEKLAAIKASIERKEYVSPDPKKETTEQWLMSWFRNFYCIDTKQSTQATTLQGIKAHLIPALGRIQLQKLTSEHIQIAIKCMKENGLSSATIQRHIKTLKQALEQAVKLKKIYSNPADYVSLPRIEKKEIQFLTDEEQLILKQYIPKTTHGRAILFLLGTGMRVSEACGLKWKDAKPDGIHVERTNMSVQDWKDEGYINVETLPKTSNGKRVIPLNKTLLGILEEQRKAQMEECLKTGITFDRVDGYIFANTRGNPADRHNLSRSFRSICKKAGIAGRGIHALRHTFATNWVRNSPDVPSLSRIMGHFDAAFTYKTYCHADQNSMSKGMEMMEQFIAV